MFIVYTKYVCFVSKSVVRINYVQAVECESGQTCKISDDDEMPYCDAGKHP